MAADTGREPSRELRSRAARSAMSGLITLSLGADASSAEQLLTASNAVLDLRPGATARGNLSFGLTSLCRKEPMSLALRGRLSSTARLDERCTMNTMRPAGERLEAVVCRLPPCQSYFYRITWFEGLGCSRPEKGVHRIVLARMAEHAKLTLALMRAGVPNMEILAASTLPALVKVARKHNLEQLVSSETSSSSEANAEAEAAEAPANAADDTPSECGTHRVPTGAPHISIYEGPGGVYEVRISARIHGLSPHLRAMMHSSHCLTHPTPARELSLVLTIRAIATKMASGRATAFTNSQTAPCTRGNG